MVRRVTPSQYNAMIRRYNQEVDRVNRALRQEADRINRARKQAVDQYNREVDRVNRANKQAMDQYNREVDRVNRANRQAVEQHNREVWRRNQNTQRAIAQYNQLVRSHNTQVRSDAARLTRQINTLRSKPVVTRYSSVRSSTYSLHESFQRVQSEATTSTAHADLVALAERESSNSIEVVSTLLEENPADAVGPEENTGIVDYLSGLSKDLCERWKGALFALNPMNPDAARHFCTSVREIFTEILEGWANDADVIAAEPTCDRTQTGKPTRRAKIRYLLNLKGINAPELAGFVDSDIDNVIELFNVFNEATHGAAGKHGFSKLQAIRQRVEGGIMFLAAVAA